MWIIMWFFHFWSDLPAASLTFLGLLLCGGLGGHVDGCCGHWDGAPAGHQVELHSLPGDEGGGHLHLLWQAEVWAEAGHEVSRGDEVHAGLQRLEDQLETPADLLLGDPGDGADLCGGNENWVSVAKKSTLLRRISIISFSTVWGWRRCVLRGFISDLWMFLVHLLVCRRCRDRLKRWHH